jgi:hypothetical protein
MKGLVNVYNSNSINKAFTNLSAFNNFNGSINVDSLKKDSTILGTIDGDSISIFWRKNKANISFTTHRQLVFQNIKDQADNKLFSQGDYSRGSRTISRHYYAYCNKPEMKFGDLWFIVTECRKHSDKTMYYQVQLKPYPED